MRVDSKALIAGVPALRVRDFLRRNPYAWNPEDLASALKISLGEGQALVEALLGLTYIEPADPAGYYCDEGCYHTTMNGAQFASATAALPLTRRVADRKLSEFFDRVRAVNANSEYLYWVRRAIVFGSYLSDKERINDVDVAVELIRKIDDGEAYMRALWRRVAVARANGRTFRGDGAKFAWPQTEVLVFLQNRSRVIALITADNKVLEHAEKRVYDFSLPDGRELVDQIGD